MKKKEERTLKRKTLLKTGLVRNCFETASGQSSNKKKEFPLTGNSFLYTM